MKAHKAALRKIVRAGGINTGILCVIGDWFEGAPAFTNANVFFIKGHGALPSSPFFVQRDTSVS